MKPKHIAKAAPDRTSNPLWVSAAVMAIFFAVAAILIGLG